MGAVESCSGIRNACAPGGEAKPKRKKVKRRIHRRRKRNARINEEAVGRGKGVRRSQQNIVFAGQPTVDEIKSRRRRRRPQPAAHLRKSGSRPSRSSTQRRQGPEDDTNESYDDQEDRKQNELEEKERRRQQKRARRRAEKEAKRAKERERLLEEERKQREDRRRQKEKKQAEAAVGEESSAHDGQKVDADAKAQDEFEDNADLIFETIEVSNYDSTATFPLDIPVFDGSIGQIERGLECVLELYKGDQMLNASKLLNKVARSMKETFDAAKAKGRKDIADVIKSHWKKLKTDSRLKYIRAMHQELQQMLDFCSDDKQDDWQSLGTSKGVTTLFRKEEDTPTYSFQVIGEVDCPIFNVIAMVNEIDLYDTWMPALNAAKKISSIDDSRIRMVLQLQYDSVWPVSDREVLCYAYGDVVGKSVLVFFRSVRDGKEVGDTKEDFGIGALPDVPKKHVRADLKYGGFLLTPLGPRKTLIKCAFNVDPRLDFLPWSLLNFISSKFCNMLIHVINDSAKKLDSRYILRIKTDTRVYGEIMRRLALALPESLLVMPSEEELEAALAEQESKANKKKKKKKKK